MRYVFGTYTLDVRRDELRTAEGVVQIDRQVFAVLAYLVQHHDRVVRRQELFEQLWPERFVSEAALERCIAVARKAVGDSGRTQHLIQTVHGRGYRFVASVEAYPDAPSVPALPTTSPAPCVLEASPPLLPEIVASLSAPALLLPASPVPPPAELRPPRQLLPAGERRQVTVLYGTLAYATALADRLGWEAFRQLAQTFRTLAQDCMQRYEGTIQTLDAEGVLALFGVPVAQEEHAWRAVQAALALQQRLREASAGREALTARVGLHTGWVVAGSHRDESSQSMVVGGDTTQGAMHVQALAAPGTVVMSDTTQRLLRATVHSTAAGVVRLPGHPAPLTVYTMQGLEAPTATRVWSPFVGRQRELAVFDDLLTRVLRGQGQVVGLIGEPGIGKSRFLAECRQRLPEQPVTVLEGYCRSYAHLLPYGPLGDLLRQQCGLSATAPPDVVATQVDALLRTLGLAPEDSAPYLVRLLGGSAAAEPLAQLTPEAIKERTFTTLRQVHLHSSQQQPLLLVVENLHWIDPTSEAYLASLVEQLAGMPLLLLTTYRPGYRPLWMEKSYATQLTLPRLTPEESAVVVRAVLPPAQHAAALVQRILARAAGNPLFLEEVAYTVREQGSLAAADAVPETIQAVLAARLDRLPLEAKRLVQIAAVIGPEVPRPWLQWLAGLAEEPLQRGLAHLQDAELLYETQFVPEQVYTFKHALTHEVAYNSLLQERRRALHAQLVDVLETRVGDRQDAQQVDRLAHHALQGGVWDKALMYSRQAGAKALARSAYREAVMYFEQALEALARLTPDRPTLEQAVDLRCDLDAALLPLGQHEQRLTHLRAAEQVAVGLEDQHRLGYLYRRLANALRNTQAYESALAYCQHAQAIATSLGDTGLQRWTNLEMGWLYVELGDYRQALPYLQQLLTGPPEEQRDQSFRTAIHARLLMIRCLSELGGFVEGLAYGDEALPLVEASARLYERLIVYWRMGYLYMRQGILFQALPLLERAVALSQEVNIPEVYRLAAPRLALTYALAGRATDALIVLGQVVGNTGVPLDPLTCGEAYLFAGCMEEAQRLAQQVLTNPRHRKRRSQEARALWLLGEIAMHGNSPDVVQAATYYQQGLTLAEELGMRPLQAHFHHGLGTLYAQSGQRAHAHIALTTAIELYRAMEMTFWLPEAEAALVQVA